MRPTWLRLLLLLLAAALQFRQLNSDRRFHADEAHFMTFARAAAVNGDWMLPGALDKPPLTIYISALSMVAFGVVTDDAGVLHLDPLIGEFAGRLPNALAALLVVAMMMRLARHALRSEGAALLAGALTAVSPFVLACGASAFTDMGLLFFSLLAWLLLLEERYAVAGAALGLAFCCKPQALLVLPLLLGQVFILRAKPGDWLRTILPALLFLGTLLAWDSARPETSLFSLSAFHNAPSNWIAEPGSWLPRLVEWLRHGAWLLGPPLVTAGLLLFGLLGSLMRRFSHLPPIDMGGPRGVDKPGEPRGVDKPGEPRRVDKPGEPSGLDKIGEPRRVDKPGEPRRVDKPEEPRRLDKPGEPSGLDKPGEPRRVDMPGEPRGVDKIGEPSGVDNSRSSIERLSLTFVIAYLACHVIVSFQLYDRYLLLILPPLILLSASSVRFFRARRLILPLVILIAAALWIGRDGSPIGPRHDINAGIDALSRHLNQLPVASVIYDPWLGWELGYYLGQWHDKRRTHFPTAEALVAGALALKEIGDRYFVAPIHKPHRDWLDSLAAAGFDTALDYQSDSFRVYRVSPPQPQTPHN